MIKKIDIPCKQERIFNGRTYTLIRTAIQKSNLKKYAIDWRKKSKGRRYKIIKCDKDIISPYYLYTTIVDARRGIKK